MKLVAALLVTMASLNVFAADLAAETTLDFRAVSGGFNAGAYHVTAEITASGGAPQSKIVRSLQRDDNDYFCVSTVDFPVGTMKVTIQNLGSNEVIIRDVVLRATASISEETANCTVTADSFVGEQTLYVATTNRPYVLSVTPPAGYDKVQIWLSPFQTLAVKARLVKAGEGLVLETRGLFSAGLFEADNQLALIYYLTATQGTSTLSLSVGNTPMSLLRKLP